MISPQAVVQPGGGGTNSTAGSSSQVVGTLPNPNDQSAIAWFTQWTAILLIVVLLANTKWGRPIVYYMLWLAILLLVLGHNQDFVNILQGKVGQ